MKISFAIPGMTFVRVGIGFLAVMSGVSFLMFAPTWATHISSEVFARTGFDATAIMSFIGACSLVYGCTLLLGIYTRTSAFAVLVTQCAFIALDFNAFSIASLALPLGVSIFFLSGADDVSVDRVYLSPTESQVTPPQSFGSRHVDSSIAEPSFSKTLNAFLFCVIGFLLLIIGGYAITFVRDTPVLRSAVAVVLEPRAVAIVEQRADTVPQTPTAVTPTPAKPQAPASKPVTPVKTGYTMAQVAQHASATSCYSVVNGVVYDLSKWISSHPGGSSAIVGMCGVDASAAFTGQHGGEARPTSELTSFKIGPLIK